MGRAGTIGGRRQLCRNWSSVGLEPPLEQVPVDMALTKLAAELVLRIRDRGVKCIAFDMDRTLCRRHSNGRLRRKAFATFAKSVTPDFIVLAQAAQNLQPPLFLAVATASDRAEGPVYHPGRTDELLL